MTSLPPPQFTAHQRDPGETAIGYEEYTIWLNGKPVGSASFVAGQGSHEKAIANYLERQRTKTT